MEAKQYSHKAIRQFIGHHFGITSVVGQEIRVAECPECGEDKFYFNTSKQLGHCHRATCDYSCNLNHLINVVGMPPSEDPIHASDLVKEEKPYVDIELPAALYNVVDITDDGLRVYSEMAMRYLRERGIPEWDAARFNLKWDGKHIYVPVTYDGSLESYVRRLVLGEGKRYDYPVGGRHSQIFFGWEEAKDWPRVTLVENTFVAIANRNKHHCTTNFGSYLGEAQIRLLELSKCATIALLWDEGAEKRAGNAVDKLRRVGKSAAYALMRGQPDDHDEETLSAVVLATHKAARQGATRSDYFGRTRQ